MAISPTAEGFRAVFRRPSLAAAEISWRWASGAAATSVFFFGLFEYLSTLPVSNGELLFLRSRQPYLVSQALAHILQGTGRRALAAVMVAALLLALLWIVLGSLGRLATVRVLLDYFKERAESLPPASDRENDREVPVATGPFAPLVRINFLRATVGLAAVLGVVGASIVAGFVSPAANPQPGLAFLVFVALLTVVVVICWALNWLLSLAGMFAARDGMEPLNAIDAAVSFCRERTSAVFAVSTWTGLAHLVAFVCATMAVSMPLGLAGALPWRLVVLSMALLTLVYFLVADWLYVARLAGYVAILEMPEMPPVPAPPPIAPRPPEPPVQTTIDRDEVILSDIPGQASATAELRSAGQPGAAVPT